MKKITGIPADRSYSADEFKTANERVRAAREKLLGEPAAREAYQRLGKKFASHLEGKRARLADVRKAVGLTQEQLAETLGMDQGEISRLEHRENLHLSTLCRFIEATGGELHLIARFGTSEIELAIGDIAPDADETEDHEDALVRAHSGLGTATRRMIFAEDQR